jgi:subtilisin family serine protease
VAGTVGGTSFGVAKQVSLVPVRVLDCAGSGSYSGVIAGIDFAANSPRRPAVANMSLGGTRSAAVNAAVAGAVAKGVNFVVAAGNDNVDACNASPASEPSAITVGATTSTDARASYSNWGTCLDVFAPGSSITSAWSTGSTATNTISGTSMATPHVTGIAALAAQANPGATPAAIAALVSGSATPNKISGAGTGSVNLLAYSLLGAASQTTVAVSSMAGAAQAVKRSWRAGVTVGIRNLATGAGVPGVTVTGSFAPGGGANCVTGSTGTCSLNSAIFADSTMVTVFTIGSAAGTNLVYDATQNTASQIRVYRP